MSEPARTPAVLLAPGFQLGNDAPSEERLVCTSVDNAARKLNVVAADVAFGRQRILGELPGGFLPSECLCADIARRQVYAGMPGGIHRLDLNGGAPTRFVAYPEMPFDESRGVEREKWERARPCYSWLLEQSSDGRQLVAFASRQGAIDKLVVIDVEDGRIQATTDLSGFSAGIDADIDRRIALLPTRAVGAQLVRFHLHGQEENPEVLASLPDTFDGASLRPGADEAALWRDGRVFLWKWRENALEEVGEGFAARWSPRGDGLYILRNGRTLTVWRGDGPQRDLLQLQSDEPENANTTWCTPPVMSPNGEWLLAKLVTNLGGKKVHLAFSFDLTNRLAFRVQELPPFMMSVEWM